MDRLPGAATYKPDCVTSLSVSEARPAGKLRILAVPRPFRLDHHSRLLFAFVEMHDLAGKRIDEVPRFADLEACAGALIFDDAAAAAAFEQSHVESQTRDKADEDEDDREFGPAPRPDNLGVLSASARSLRKRRSV